jgi:hypothetical protein
MKKYQTGGNVPNGMVKGEMTGKLYPKAEMDKREDKMADMLDRQSGKGKYAPKQNPAITNKPLSEKKPAMKLGGKIKKFAALAPPKNKVTFADKIAGAKKKK